MDFKSLMSAQIAKSKQSDSRPSSAATSSKYLRRVQLETARHEAYLKEQADLNAEREERAAKKRKLEDEEAEKDAKREQKLRRLAEESKQRREEEEAEEERKRRKRLGLPELLPPTTATIADGSVAAETQQDGEIGGEDIPDDELRKKLRELNEPSCVFDEDHPARLKRYYTLTRQNAAAAAAVTTTISKPLTDGPIPTTLEPLPGKDLLVPETLPAQNTPEHEFLDRQLASYFTLLLKEWNHALSTREDAVKASASGKQAHTAYLTVVRDLTPLFRQLESQTLDPSLMGPICKIVRSIQRRRYVEANDEYLTLSIGKAAWPIGVTMVGIHERSAREKLHETSSGKQAHILSDEVTRKFLQSIKRCISFAQTRWPPEDLGQLMG